MNNNSTMEFHVYPEETVKPVRIRSEFAGIKLELDMLPEHYANAVTMKIGGDPVYAVFASDCFTLCEYEGRKPLPERGCVCYPYFELIDPSRTISCTVASTLLETTLREDFRATPDLYSLSVHLNNYVRRGTFIYDRMLKRYRREYVGPIIPAPCAETRDKQLEQLRLQAITGDDR